MEEQQILEWRKKDEGQKSEFIKNLELLISGVVMNEIKDINSKVETLVKMGLIQDGPEIQELRDKMKQLQMGINK